MQPSFWISSLIPRGFAVESVSRTEKKIIVTARAETRIAACPACRSPSRRIHSRYVRQVSDLPCAGREVQLHIVTRRFVCAVRHCRRRIFAERFDNSVLAARSRRTARLECIVHHLGLALGGRPGAHFANRLMLPVSNDTLLRVVRRRAELWKEPLTVVGIDDWAFRRNHRYGTIVCDLELRRIVTLLPDREIARLRLGFAAIPRSPSCRGIGVAAMARRRQGRYPTRSRLPTAGTSWRTQVRRFSMPYANPCGRSAPQSVPRRSIPTCLPVLKDFSMKAIFGARRPLPRSWPWSRTASRSDRLFAEPATAASLSGKWYVVNGLTSSESYNPLSRPICPALIPNGPMAAAMAPNSGAV